MASDISKTPVNRIEYADDSILQRGNWRPVDVKAAVERATNALGKKCADRL